MNGRYLNDVGWAVTARAMTTTAHKKPGKMETRLSMVIMALVLWSWAPEWSCASFRINPAVVALRPESHRHVACRRRVRPALIDARGSGMAPLFSPGTVQPGHAVRKNQRPGGPLPLFGVRFPEHPAVQHWTAPPGYGWRCSSTTWPQPENAFSVFSMQRREGARAIGRCPRCLPHGKRPVHGPGESFYLEFIGTDASPRRCNRPSNRLAQRLS
jgi:hypothetical protein